MEKPATNFKKPGKTLKMSTVGSKMPPSVSHGIPTGGHGIPGYGSPTEGGIFDPTVLIFEVVPGLLMFFHVFPCFFNREIDFSIKNRF